MAEQLYLLQEKRQNICDPSLDLSILKKEGQ